MTARYRKMIKLWNYYAVLVLPTLIILTGGDPEIIISQLYQVFNDDQPVALSSVIMKNLEMVVLNHVFVEVHHKLHPLLLVIHISRIVIHMMVICESQMTGRGQAITRGLTHPHFSV